jgi:DNA-binding response OmpR family regulator
MMEYMTQLPVLLVERCDPVVQETQATLLNQGFDVEQRSSGADGQAFAQHGEFGLIVMGAQLDDGPAYEWCWQMRNTGVWQPILILAAAADALDKILCLEMGADDYLAAPYDRRELTAHIRALLRRAFELSRAERAITQAGDLVIDRQRGQVSRNHRPLNLTPTEFRLLSFLAAHPGQVLTRSQIADHVWPHAIDLGSEDAINVYICRLRQKVERNPLRPSLILTVPGLGYRLAG